MNVQYWQTLATDKIYRIMVLQMSKTLASVWQIVAEINGKDQKIL